MDGEDAERLRALASFQNNFQNMDQEHKERLIAFQNHLRQLQYLMSLVTYMTVVVSLLEDAEHEADGLERERGRRERGPCSGLPRELAEMREQNGKWLGRLHLLIRQFVYELWNGIQQGSW